MAKINQAKSAEIETKVFEAIKMYITQNHIPPSVSEIREIVGISSNSVVHRYISKLEVKGLIKRKSGISRSIVIID
jgi:SOS-response transcriptional repressor LexA